MQDETTYQKELEAAARYAAWAALTPEGRAKHRGGVLFKAPRKLDYMRLIPHTELRHRQGFKLTDPGTDLAGDDLTGVQPDAQLQRDAVAALDVHEREGPGRISPGADLPNVILTPHIGAGTVDAQHQIGVRLV